MHTHASLFSSFGLIAVACLLESRFAVLCFLAIPWPVHGALAAIAGATSIVYLGYWQPAYRMVTGHLGLIGLAAFCAFCIVEFSPLRVKFTTVADTSRHSARHHVEGIALADLAVGILLTATVAYFLIVMEVCLTNGDMAQAITTLLVDSPNSVELFLIQ